LLLVVATCGWFWRHYLKSIQGGKADAPAAGVDRSGHSLFHVQSTRRETSVDRRMEKVDPQSDGWTSEVMSSAAGRQLDRLRRLIEQGAKSVDTSMADLVTAEFTGETSTADSLEIVFDEPMFRVQRLVKGRELKRTRSLSNFLAELLNHNDPAEVAQCSFKVIDIQPRDNGFESRVLVELMQRTSSTMEQKNATWSCTWDASGDLAETGPRLRSITLADYEHVSFKGGNVPLFQDVTSSAIAATDQVLRGIGHWSERLTGIDDMHIYGHHGIALADINGDGFDDLYVCDSGGLPNRVYVQRPDGTAIDFSGASGVDFLESTASALLVDLDNDGDQDLVAATVAGIVFASNDGQGHFTIRNALAGVAEAHSICAADYDNDADVDVYVCVYGPGGAPGGRRGFEASLPVPYNDANNGGRNLLLENQGRFRFVDVTQQRGLDQNNRRWSFAASWEDFDTDGDMDLYVANDFGRNSLYRNEKGQFTDVADVLGVEDMAAGMSVSWGDYNRDGRMDIYVGNMFSAAGNRITYQRRFVNGRESAVASGIQRMARGNSLFAAQPDGSFADVSESAAVTMGRWAWSSLFTDLNNDGWQDLVVANGYFSNDKADDL
jgi:hypothetical protein